MVKRNIALAALLVSTSAFAADVVMFGEVAIGDQLSIPKCADNYEVTTHPLCYTGGGRRYVFLEFPHGQAPSYIGETPPSVYLQDGKVIGMMIPTKGVVSQAEAFSDLQQKFGKPLTKDVSKVSTIRGASFDSINASWAIGDIKVMFHGTLSHIDSGAISVMTPEGWEMLQSTTPTKRQL